MWSWLWTSFSNNCRFVGFLFLSRQSSDDLEILTKLWCKKLACCLAAVILLTWTTCALLFTLAALQTYDISTAWVNRASKSMFQPTLLVAASLSRPSSGFSNINHWKRNENRGDQNQFEKRYPQRFFALITVKQRHKLHHLFSVVTLMVRCTSKRNENRGSNHHISWSTVNSLLVISQSIVTRYLSRCLSAV